MYPVIKYSSRKPSNPLHNYSYVHDSQLPQPRQTAVTIHTVLSVSVQPSVLNSDWTYPGEFPSHPLKLAQMDLQSQAEKCLLHKISDHHLH